MSTAVLRQGPRFHTLRKYKSTYMKRGFTRDKAGLIYKHLTLETTEDVGGILAVDSYGCAVQPARVRRPHLHPAARLRPQAPIPEILEEALQNEAHLKWMGVFYTDLYSGPAHKGTSYQISSTRAVTSTTRCRYALVSILASALLRRPGTLSVPPGGQAQVRPEQHLSPFHVGARLTVLVETAVSI
jgi:hypothetical protein